MITSLKWLQIRANKRLLFFRRRKQQIGCRQQKKTVSRLHFPLLRAERRQGSADAVTSVIDVMNHTSLTGSETSSLQEAQNLQARPLEECDSPGK